MKTPEEIIGDVACITGVPAPVITGQRRTPRIARARFLAFAAIRSAFPWFSLADIAEALNRMDHGTTSHALHRFRQLYQTEDQFRLFASQLNLQPSLD